MSRTSNPTVEKKIPLHGGPYDGKMLAYFGNVLYLGELAVIYDGNGKDLAGELAHGEPYRIYPDGSGRYEPGSTSPGIYFVKEEVVDA